MGPSYKASTDVSMINAKLVAMGTTMPVNTLSSGLTKAIYTNPSWYSVPPVLLEKRLVVNTLAQQAENHQDYSQQIWWPYTGDKLDLRVPGYKAKG